MTVRLVWISRRATGFSICIGLIVHIYANLGVQAMYHKALTVSTFVLIISFVFASSAVADDKWIVRGYPSYFLTADDSSPVMVMQDPPFGEETIAQDIDSAAGFGLSLEYMWRERIGFEGAIFLSSHDTNMRLSNDLGSFDAVDSTSLRTITLGANYYFAPSGNRQWAIGAFVPLMFVDGTDHEFPGLGRTEHRDYDQDYGLGLKGAITWTFGADSPWSFSAEARYMGLLVMEAESIGDVDVDPLVLSLGVGYRF